MAHSFTAFITWLNRSQFSRLLECNLHVAYLMCEMTRLTSNSAVHLSSYRRKTALQRWGLETTCAVASLFFLGLTILLWQPTHSIRG